MQKINILWADDEIDLLKPHILFLKAKGYQIKAVTNGEDAIELCKNDTFDLVFLDENMPGLTGLETLNEIKNHSPHLPVIMITKSEEEHIMEEAIGNKISDYLIKPVNPNQILLAIKKITDNKRLVSEKTTSKYQQDFRNLGTLVNENLNSAEWSQLYQRLVQWELDLQNIQDTGMLEVFAMQKADANTQFAKFIKRNYLGWFSSKASDAPVLSHQVLQKFLFPVLDANSKYYVLLIDNLRLDQYLVIETVIGELFRLIKQETYISILPTSTDFARNAFFAGLLPSEIKKRFPDKWIDGDTDEGSKNQHEAFFLQEHLKRFGKNIKTSYHKVVSLNQGKQLVEQLSNLKNNNLNVIVYNFVDMLSHARTEMNMIKELAEDEAAYRSITKSWLLHAPLYEMLKKIAEQDFKLIITTDHGSIRVQSPSRIVGDRNTTTNLRYKEGKNLNFDDKSNFEINKPEEAYLPKPYLSSSYVFAIEDRYFVYPNNYNQYVNLYKNTFQHGGISLEEMIIPFAFFEPK